jgi:hypothetical protein
MCTGPSAARCTEERLAWELYHEHGYRPRALRPCLTPPDPVGPAASARPSRWRGVLRLLPGGRPARGAG